MATDERSISSHSNDKEATEDVYSQGTIDPIYQRKAHILNDAILDIGMGKYQWALFVVTGFGWLADNLWPIVTGLILPPVVQEFQFQGPFLKLGQNIGLLVGAVFWGVGSDIWGRRSDNWSSFALHLISKSTRISFNITLLITGVFALAAGGSPNYVALSSFAAVWSIGVGGNLPVDSAIFLEFLPKSHQYLLTVLSIWWAFGQLLGSLVAWPLIGNYSCETDQVPCPRSANQGWRYFLFAMGGLMMILWGVRFFIFKLYESPKYLMGRGRDADAVEVVHKVARYNGKESTLTLEDLRKAGGEKENQDSKSVVMDTSVRAAIRRNLRELSGDHVRPLFANAKLAWSTSLIITLWALIGLAFPLCVFLHFPRINADILKLQLLFYPHEAPISVMDPCTSRIEMQQTILSVIGVPGALLAGYLVELPLLGRRGTLAISTVLTGVFILASTTARTSDALLGWNCAYSFTSNVMYGVLYALTPELFPTKDRGTGNALAAAANRVFGVMAPIIALYADLTTSVPMFVSGALFLLAGVISLLLPFESRGKAALFYGITILQTVVYYKQNPNDPWLFRYGVAFLWILDTVQVALSTHALYFYLIKSFGNYPALLSIIWSFPLQLLANMLIICGVQALYAVRIWKLGRHFHMVLPWFIFLAVAATFGTGVYVMYDTYTLATFTSLEISAIKVSIYAVFSTMAGADFIIAGTMCFYLHKGRSMTSFSSTTNIIKGLMRLVVISGILTSACSLFTVVAYAGWPNTLTFIAIDLVLPKRQCLFFACSLPNIKLSPTVYINSLLAMLNSRPSSGANVGRPVPQKMIRFAPHDTESGLIDSGQTVGTFLSV
ncbi:related to 4-hydroxybenzoate transporter [Armillaria ostoyae]|uniref:Related to 4-hydroxybenzoate transporter n=1 Tax=Armillaria ostoyae TaxID=47428 RepID=A0A284S979_ARMOS|nr:related to 4-hydroxybenzoate transporter [Armillaria ostoyae]